LNRIVVLAIIIIIIIAGIILASYLGSQKPETTLIPESGVSSQVTAEVNKYLTTKIVSSDEKVTVYIPANAIKGNGYLVLTSMEPNLFTDSNDEWNRPVIVNLDLYDELGKLITEPDIVSFLDICFFLNEKERNDYIDHRENYYIQYYDEKSGQNEWKKLNYSIKSDSNQLCGEIDHLTLFSLAIKGEAKISLPTPVLKLYQIPAK
jgi:hypothetical protein